MKLYIIKRYALNCFLLTMPVLFWDLILINKLPAAFKPTIFWYDIPPLLAIGEHTFRIIIFVLAFLMPLSVVYRYQKIGLALYLTGILLYFASWLVLICFPYSEWSNSRLGFMAPAYTPLFWLTGIAIIGQKLCFNFLITRYGFIVFSMGFIVFHNLHTLIIYNRIH